MADREVPSLQELADQLPSTNRDSELAAAQAIAEAEGLSDTPKSFSKLAWERFINHRLALLGAIGLVLITVAFVFAPQLSDYTVEQTNVPDRLQGPSWDHPFGTDEIGRDLYVRTAQGGQYSLRIGLTVAVLATAFGTMMGAMAGYFGRWVDTLISQMVNLFLIVPYLIILAVFSQQIGRDANRLSLVLALLLWTRIARVVRGEVLSIKQMLYVEAARGLGASNFRIITRQVLPNALGPIVVGATLAVGYAIILEFFTPLFNLSVVQALFTK